MIRIVRCKDIRKGRIFTFQNRSIWNSLLTIARNLLKNREAVKQRYKNSNSVVSPKEDTISNADEVFMRKLNELISDQLENPDLDVNYVATQMAMSRASLYNKLKVLTDVSIGDYINKFRMARVMELLADKDLSILEVSEREPDSLTRGISARYLNRCTE